MSQIRTAKSNDVAAFPGSKFVIDGTPPDTQCKEPQIASFAATIVNGLPTMTEIGLFAGIDLTGKEVQVFAPPASAGIYAVLSNTDDAITTDHTFTEDSGAAAATVQDPGENFLTRNESSFTRYIENAGQAHTTKGGQLFTDIPDPPMDDACTTTFNPD